MKEFMMAASPWVCMGIAIALVAVSCSVRRKSEKSDRKYGTYTPKGTGSQKEADSCS